MGQERRHWNRYTMCETEHICSKNSSLPRETTVRTPYHTQNCQQSLETVSTHCHVEVVRLLHQLTVFRFINVILWEMVCSAKICDQWPEHKTQLQYLWQWISATLEAMVKVGYVKRCFRVVWVIINTSIANFGESHLHSRLLRTKQVEDRLPNLAVDSQLVECRYLPQNCTTSYTVVWKKTHKIWKLYGFLLLSYNPGLKSWSSSFRCSQSSDLELTIKNLHDHWSVPQQWQFFLLSHQTFPFSEY